MQRKQKIIFIASYPKSGNTWLRSIISSLVYNADKEFRLKDLKKILLFSQFANFQNIEGHEFQSNGNLNYNWISNNWIKAQEQINLIRKKNIFFKTHSVRGIVNKNFFTDETVCLGFIYIVRDPRDVAISLSKHMGIDIELALKEILFSERRMTSFDKVNELVSTWKNNLDSWMQFKSVPRLILRYEDMINDVDVSIGQIVEFLNKIGDFDINTNKNFLESVKLSTNFKKLQLLEKDQKFDEATPHSRFFRKGIVGEWKQVLTIKQVKLIEDELAVPMKQLVYI